MTETESTNETHLIICEGTADYCISPTELTAKQYAQRKAREAPDTHWIVWKAVCGFVQKNDE